jgi:hypothetical protein
VTIGENNDGPVDHSRPLLWVTDPDGKVRGILVNAAGHDTARMLSFPTVSPGSARPRRRVEVCE